MALFDITAYSPELDCIVRRNSTEDGSAANFLHKSDAEASAAEWLRLLQERKFMDVADWILSVDKA